MRSGTALVFVYVLYKTFLGGKARARGLALVADPRGLNNSA